MSSEPVLEIKGLTVSFGIKDEYYPAVDHLDLTVNPLMRSRTYSRRKLPLRSFAPQWKLADRYHFAGAG
ncbi:hypothetical protein ACIFQM_16225 [Paenibacillus sp. NRS-1782]|uniref:hypothetical protein n=1 Tax=unclassified Paenibacillus TaxID=185978 RepID=UPI003D2C776D